MGNIHQAGRANEYVLMTEPANTKGSLVPRRYAKYSIGGLTIGAERQQHATALLLFLRRTEGDQAAELTLSSEKAALINSWILEGGSRQQRGNGEKAST